MGNNKKVYIAHVRKDGDKQSIEDHLSGVGEIAAKLATKIGASSAGNLIGLLHDFGKFSKEFQDYIGSATGQINSDEDEYVDFRGLKGKIDHSSAGAQWVWQCFGKRGAQGELVGQILALCIASHHSGLIDCLKPDGDNGFLKRMKKPDDKTHKNECLKNAPPHYLEKIGYLADKELLKNIITQLQKVIKIEDEKLPATIQSFNLGFWTRMLFSCLIDADRINSADFEIPENSQYRNSTPVDWSIPVNRLESAIKEFSSEREIDKLRRNISETCKQRAKDKKGIYSLTVPTGGGKTYASLRYALHHALHHSHKNHKIDRIIYVIPFTSIIEQNAQAIREVIDCSKDEHSWVLEQHSNLEPETQTWHSKLVAENWDAPIVMTTMVQFLEVLFSGGTRGARKMHQLANSVLIFDEIQTLPINCTHLFCNALNFLTSYCNTTAVLCTATQPLLDQLKTPEKGQLTIPSENELAGDVTKLFKDLKRTKVVPNLKVEGWTTEQIAELALGEFNKLGSCLVIVNTKAWAQQLYQTLQPDFEMKKGAIFQLSTNLCPAHRKTILKKVRQRLEQGLPVLCISTQLIEAGVDVDFASVIRFLAGLDSIAQAAGRCNRNGRQDMAIVHVVNPAEEKIDLLKDIKTGRDKAQRIFGEGFNDLLAPDAIKQYFKYYFYERANEMTYPISAEKLGRDDNLLNLLSSNTNNVDQHNTPRLLRQSFMTAGKAFKAIDSPTQAVIVPYGEGINLIAELGRVAKEFDVKTYRKFLKQAQKYSVNVFPNVWKRLQEENAVHEIQQGEAIYYLEEKYYSDNFGLSDKPCNKMNLLSF